MTDAAPVTFHRIAYEALEVCNALPMEAIDTMLARTRLGDGASAVDIGCGNAAVSIRLAERFGLQVEAIELDAGMAELAQARIAASSATSKITLHQARSGDAMAALPAPELIVAIGTTDPAGDGRLEPAEVFSGLKARLKPGGWLLWGDLFWADEPPAPLRQIMELTNRYASHQGWQDAACEAGLAVEAAEVSDDAAWAHYLTTMERAAADWLAANPDHPDHAAVQTRAGQVAALFQFGRPYLGFGLYLLRG